VQEEPQEKNRPSKPRGYKTRVLLNAFLPGGKTALDYAGGLAGEGASFEKKKKMHIEISDPTIREKNQVIGIVGLAKVCLKKWRFIREHGKKGERI